MRFTAGDRIGVYEIRSALGAGGMGEVYRAFDPRLDREVALKVLLPAAAEHVEALVRFEREARAVAALSHPNILAIHDFGTDRDVAYAVMELLDGDTLRERLVSGRLPVRKAIDYATQIALGLAAAHERGVVHRDLKPENIALLPDGRVKILDFGLARQMPWAATASIAPTTPIATSAGTVLGTVGYMAPEQVRGDTADARSDIFAFGAVLYEMVTGSRAFHGTTAVETMTAILREDPPDVAADIPAAIDRIVRHCLEKNPAERFQSARDIAFALDAATSATGSLPAVAGRSRLRLRRLVAAAAAAATLGAGGYVAGLKRAPAPSLEFKRLTFRRGVIFNARFDTDGRSILYSASFEGGTPELFSTRRDGPDSRALGIPAADIAAVSTTGEMALIRNRGPMIFWYSAEPGLLARATVGGGVPRDVATDIISADWSPDGSQLAVVRRVGGKHLIEFPLGTVRYETTAIVTRIRIAPDGRRLAFNEKGFGFGQNSVIRVWDGTTTLSLPTDAGADRIEFAWSPTGTEVWFGEGVGATSNNLRAVDMRGRMRTVAVLPIGFHLFDITSSGAVLAGRTSIRSSVIEVDAATDRQRELSWLDMSEGDDATADGSRVLLTEFGEGGGLGRWSVFVRPTDGSPAVRLGDGQAFALSPDGRSALALRRGPPPTLVVLPTGAGQTRELSNPAQLDYFSASWLHDGMHVVFAAQKPGHGLQYWIQSIDGAATPVTPENIFAVPGLHPMSHDDRLLASERRDHVLAVFPVDGGTPKVFPDALGLKPIRWSDDDRALYVASDELPTRVLRLDIGTGRTQLVRTLMPSDPAGVINIHPVLMTRRSFVYTYQRDLTDLYLIDGLK